MESMRRWITWQVSKILFYCFYTELNLIRVYSEESELIRDQMHVLQRGNDQDNPEDP